MHFYKCGATYTPVWTLWGSIIPLSISPSLLGAPCLSSPFLLTTGTLARVIKERCLLSLSHVYGTHASLQDCSVTFAQMKTKPIATKQLIQAVTYLADMLFSGSRGISRTLVLAMIIS